MNNTDFRRLVESTPKPSNDASPSTFLKPSAPASSLGSRKTSSIPMTPRSIRGASSINFAQQLREQNSAEQPARKFRSAAAPKGTKFGAGYSDRALQRTQQDVEDERLNRITALEEQMKLGQIEQATFEALRDQITGGDVGATHMVKGLDRRLLERVKKGEDVMAEKNRDQDHKDTPKDEPETTPQPEVNPEEELDELETAELAPVQRAEVKKKGTKAPPPKPVAGVKRSRADILAELKATREAAAAAKAASELGSKFRKLGANRPNTSRIERDEKGREVLIIVDEDGRVKRKVRKLPKEQEARTQLLVPAKAAKPLGMVVPDVPVIADDDDGDIFEGAGDAYNPLGDLPDDDEADSSASDEDQPISRTKPDEDQHDPVVAAAQADESDIAEEAPTPTKSTPSDNAPSTQAPKRNYFNERSPSPDNTTRAKAINDPAILESIKRAAAAAAAQEAAASRAEEAEKEKSKPSSAAARLFARDRDLDDMDMGFGDSRFGDEEEEEGGKIKLSEWKDGGDDEDEEEGKKERGGQQRKRGKKKRRGDKNSAADVLAAMDRRK